jgi:hypothetical protein
MVMLPTTCNAEIEDPIAPGQSSASSSPPRGGFQHFSDLTGADNQPAETMEKGRRSAHRMEPDLLRAPIQNPQSDAFALDGL